MDSDEKYSEIIEQAKTTKFDDRGSVERLQYKLEELRSDEWNPQRYPALFHHLAQCKDDVFFKDVGLRFFSWVLDNNIEVFETEIGEPNYPKSKSPVHSAIDHENNFFLDCFIEASNDLKCEIKDILDIKRKDNGSNCLHAVIAKLLPCAGDMVAKCSRTTILAKDNESNTPLHIAMRLSQRSSTPKLNMRGGTNVVDTQTKANMFKTRSWSHAAPSVEDKSGFESVDSNKDNSARMFDPAVVYRQIKKHMLKDSMSAKEKSNFMAELLAVVNEAGRSPYQNLLERVKQDRIMAEPIHKAAADLPRLSRESFLEWMNKSKSGEKDRAGGDIAKPTEIPLQEEMKNDIFNYLVEVELVRKALYGTEGSEKELFLDMSDFSNPSHDFKGFIASLTADLPETPKSADKAPAPPTTDKGTTQPLKDNQQPKTVPRPRGTQVAAPALDKISIEFENILFYVCLPNFNNFKDPLHDEIRRLFRWLAYREVKTIRSLSIPDSNVAPMSDVLIEGAIIDNFEIEKFDWRKLDINLEILTKSKHAAKFTKLTLYSSGNWSVLHHWVSDEGLKKLGRLQKVTIIIVQLDPKNDQEARDRYEKNVTIYETRLKGKLQKMKDEILQKIKEQKLKNLKDIRPEFDFEVKTGGKWNFPVARYDQKTEPFVPNLRLVEQLQNCHSFLKRLLYASNTVTIPDDLKPKYQQIKIRLKKYIQGPPPNQPNQPDQRIKVAVIDNGADRIRNSVSDMIAKGVSYVTAGSENGDRILPWWMVADPHGTQMASLIGNANPFCRLYIARVGRGRKDILPENAAKAVRWAIEQKVDIISISWVTKKNHTLLRDAIADAVDAAQTSRSILVFCSTADEGVYSGTVYPASHKNTVRVAATDMYGHLQPESDSGVNILVPGQDVAADGPSYMEKYTTGTVSGSSVATASAAGIASLALLLLKVFNKEDDRMMRKFYTAEGIMKVFEKMHDKLHESKEVTGIELSDLFPTEKELEVKGEEQIRSLYNAWQFKEFPVQ